MRATAKLFRNGRSQAVRLPKEFRLPGDEVYIERKGGKVILSPKPGKSLSWDEYFRRPSRPSPDFMRAGPANRVQPVRESVRTLFDE